MKILLCLLLSLLLLSNSKSVAAWPWPALIPPLDTIWARQEIPKDKPASETTPAANQTPKNNDASPVITTGTFSIGPSATETGKSSNGDNSDNMDVSDPASNTTSFDARLPAGGVSMQTPAISLGQQYFKIGDHVTFGWNYTSLESTPTAVNVMATCTANKQLYTIEMNQTVANNTGLVVWDTGSYQATAVQNPLLTQTYTLIIFDSDSSLSATAQPGYLAVYKQYTFGMYSPQPYTPLGDFKCVTCSGGLSDLKRNALGMAFCMCIITLLSFSCFTKRLGLTW